MATDQISFYNESLKKRIDNPCLFLDRTPFRPDR
jgi:hypothetical protein